jgi:hypothetical protein
MKVGILVVDDRPTPRTCFSSGSVVRQETRRMINDRLPRLPDRSSGPRQRSPLGHEERFLPPRLSAGLGFGKKTFAGTRATE